MSCNATYTLTPQAYIAMEASWPVDLMHKWLAIWAQAKTKNKPKPDILTLDKTGHFYFGLTLFIQYV
jgi:hypothetical protein